MKNIYYYLNILIAICFLISCDSLLDTSPLTSLDEDKVWASEANAMTALVGCYKGTISYNATGTESDFSSYSGLMFLEFATDNALDRRATTTGNSTAHKLSDGTLNASNGSIKNYWTNGYKKIARCNRLIENIDRVPADPAVIARMKSEARFLRAIQYFYLSQYFGDVPLVINTLIPNEANNVTKASKTEIIAFLEKELSEIADILPRHKDIKPTEIGRVSAQAALIFLGRTYLADKQYVKAAAAFKRIIDWNDNIIDPDYKSIFIPANENSNEIIFATQYLEALAGNAMPQHAYPAIANGWHIVCPLGSLFESYEFINGEPFSYDNPLFDLNNLGRNRDPRLDYTLLYNGSMFGGKQYICHPDSSRSLDQLGAGKQTTYTGFGLRKFFDESYTQALMQYGGNTVVARYAEVLLSYLEAELEAGSAITQEMLDLTINRIRGRASVNMPPVTETNPDKLRPILRNERRVELALEGHRYWDLLRWGIAHEILKADFYGAPFPGAKNMRKKDGMDDPYDRWFVISRNFRNPQDYQWPIPQSEQDINPNLR
jgi:hypothetical protein